MDEEPPDIPLPDLLDPVRQVVNSRGDFLDHNQKDLIPAMQNSIAELCTYGRQLWNDANAMRTYLIRHQPATHPALDDPDRDSSSSTGPTEHQADWDAWINAYAAMTSVLAGPHGDSGFGLQEANRIAQLRHTTD